MVSRKIWRAFPQLDRYPDEVCRHYVRHALRLNEIWKGVLLCLASFVVSIGIWVGVLYLVADPVENFSSSARGGFMITIGLLLVALMLSGVVWFPILCTFITRDLWLRGVIRRQLRSSDCACGYQLIGLEIQHDSASKFVTCPECGNRIELNTGHITEADIDPQLLRCS
jgi:hypothetical protein